MEGRQQSENNVQQRNHLFNANNSGGVSLNVHLAVPPTSSAAQDGTHTPNTPEILNSIVNMQAAREAREAREASATGGPFAAEFANHCAIQSKPQQSVPASSSIVTHAVDITTTLSSLSPGNIHPEMQVPTINIIPPLNSPVASSITSESTLASPYST